MTKKVQRQVMLDGPDGRVQNVSFHWRLLEPEHREAVHEILDREQKRLCKLARRARDKAAHSRDPWSCCHGRRALRHATIAGALHVLSEMLETICVSYKEVSP